MKKCFLVVAIFICMSLSACGMKEDYNRESEVLTENSEVTEVVSDILDNTEEGEQIDWESHYSEIIQQNTDEYIVSITLNDYEHNGLQQAFVITIPQEELESYKGAELYGDWYEGISSLWYLSENTCYNVYLDSDSGLTNCESGTVHGGETVFLIDQMMDSWASERNYNTDVYLVREGTPKLIESLCSATITEDGYIYSFFLYNSGEDGMQIDDIQYDVINGEVVQVN